MRARQSGGAVLRAPPAEAGYAGRMIVALWLLFLLLLSGWSALIWGLHALLSLPAGWNHDVHAWLAGLPLAERLAQWWPCWLELAQVLADVAAMLLQALASFTPWLMPLLWLLWALGALGLLLVVGLLHWVIRSASRPAAAAPGGPSPG